MMDGYNVMFVAGELKLLTIKLNTVKNVQKR